MDYTRWDSVVGRGADTSARVEQGQAGQGGGNAATHRVNGSQTII